jgi:hypothetical protein
MERHHCTIEEIEEYEPHIMNGSVVYASVDYAAILKEAESDADVILWDGGNNDFPFYRPNLHIVVADPLRLGNELTYYPGEANLRMADVALINKIDTADLQATDELRAHIRSANPRAVIVEAASPVIADRPDLITDRRVLVVEDGPTVTHGEMRFGAGTVIAKKFGAREIVDPRSFARKPVGDIPNVPRHWPSVACHGVQRPTGARSRSHHCQGAVWCRGRGHADGPRASRHDSSTCRARAIRAAGGGAARSRTGHHRISRTVIDAHVQLYEAWKGVAVENDEAG